jgi:hypothetical protein
MKDPPRPADRSTIPMEGGLKSLAKMPRSAVVLLCLCVLGAGIVMGVTSLLFALGDETAKRVVLVFLADLNGDEHQDAFLVTNQLHRIAFNDGMGNFTSNRELMMQNYALALGDLDGNGSLDAILINFEEGMMGGNLITECAEAPADFVIPARSDDVPGQVFAIRDGNRDGLPEGYIAGCCGSRTTMMNYATLFLNHRSCLGMERPNATALGDLNGDGTLDVFLANGSMLVDGQSQQAPPNEVWFNDGQGTFTDSGQRLGDAESYAVALGDLNDDGFLDAVVGNRGGGEIWLNDGQGNFGASKQSLGIGITMTHSIFVSDLDGDGDLDLFLAGGTSIRVWLNEGAGRFKAGQRINFDRYDAFAVGDVTGDSIPDVFVGGPDSYQVWRGDGDGRFSANGRSVYR